LSRELVRAIRYAQGPASRRRGSRVLAILALLAVLPGLVMATVYVTNSTSANNNVQTFQDTSGLVCSWYGLNSTDETPLGGWGTGKSYVSIAGQGTASVTIQYNVTKGATYEYFIDEAVAVCNVAVYTTVDNIWANETAVTGSTGPAWVLATLQGGSTSGYAGAIGMGTSRWLPTAGTANNVNNNAVNPKNTAVCDNAGGGVAVPYQGYNVVGAPRLGSWSYSLNGSAWTTDACTQGHGAPPVLNPVAATKGSTLAFYFLSIEIISNAAAGVTGSVSFSIASNAY